MSVDNSSLYDQWRTNQAKRNAPSIGPALLDLPSGAKVRAKRPHILLLMRTGQIPDMLIPLVQELIGKAESGGEDAVRQRMGEMQQEDPAGFYTTWMTLLDIVWMEAVIDPVFTRDATPKDGEISITDVEDADKEFLFVWAQGVDQTVATFLDRRARSIAALGDPPTGR